MVRVGGSDQGPSKRSFHCHLRGIILSWAMLLLPLGVTTIPTNQKESRPVGILDWETVGKMLEAYGLGDILW